MRRSCMLILLAAPILLGIGCGSGPRDSVPSADGVPIHYRARGQGSPALVFIHGWCCDGHYWDAQLEHFAPVHRVVAIDLAGHGSSGANRESWTMAAYGADVVAVVEALGLQDVVLVGHSMGGAVMIEAALAMPERVRGLVGVDILQDPTVRFGPEQIEAFLTHFESDFRGMTERWVRAMFPAGADSALASRVATSMASALPEVAVPSLRALLAWFNEAQQVLPRLAMPLQCINSDRVPTNAQVMEELVQGYELRVMPGRGHFAHLEDPATFSRLLEQSLADFTGKGP